MNRLLFAALLLTIVTLPCWAVTEEGTRFSANGSTDPTTSFDASGTVPANTELLLCGIAYGGGATTVTDADWNGSEAMTEIGSVIPTSGNEIGLYAFALVAPTATTDNVTFTIAGGGGAHFATAGCISYDAVDDATVGDATDVDTPVATQVQDGVTVVMPNYGAAGNALVIFATKFGDDSDPASIDDGSYTEIFDFDSGGGQNNNNDAGFAVYQQLSAAGADGGTVTFSGGNDPRVGIQVEINTEAASPIVPITVNQARRHKQ